MDSASMIVVGLGVSLICSIGLYAVYQNYKKPTILKKKKGKQK